MSPPRRTREQVIWDFVQAWLRKAASDLRAAEFLIAQEEEEHYFAVAFHAQQAEKWLKAFLVRHQIPFPKTHDIHDLLDLAARADPSLPTELQSAAILTPFGVEFPSPSEEVADLETAREALQEARRLRDAILSRLQPYLDAGRPSDPAPPS